jgi:hypothetical protein
MFNSKNLMMLFVLVIFLAAGPTLALADESDHGSAKVTVVNTVFVAGNEIKSGEYDIKWEAGSSEATVTFMARGKTPVKLQGKIVKAEVKSYHNTLLIGKDPSGRQALKALQLGGKLFRIVFE